MADSEKHMGGESPTTAKEPDFEEDAHEETAVPAEAEASQPTPAALSPAPKKVSFQEDAREEEAPPPKPPRPMSPQAQAEATLIEAFPSMDSKVIKAVLVASGGRVEPAFNALLGMSDPDAHVEEPAPPPQPPRPSQAQRQLDADERYARQLAAHYEQSAHGGGSGSEERGPPLPRRRQQGDDLYTDDREHNSFFDDDLPRIQQNIQQGFLNTQKTVNKWINDFKKRIDGDEEEEDHGGTSREGGYQRQNFGPSQSEQLYGIRKSGEGRRSGDRERYDADPHVLSDDFTQLELRDEDPSSPQQSSRARPLANPDLFKPTPVAPQSGPVDEVDALYRDDRNPKAGATSTGKLSSGSGKKWQPLTSVAPNPEADDNDPFSLGDSDEEEAKKQDTNPEDTERLKKAASEKDKDTTTAGKLQPAERSGSIGQKNEEAERLLAGKS